MKKLVFFLAVALTILSCDNSLDLNETWKDFPVIYGFLNPSDTAQYIRVERVFNDSNTSAIQVAKIADSLYYKDINVVLIRDKTADSYPLQLVNANLDGFVRDTGVFADTPNYLYKIKTKDIVLNPSENYTLLVTRENGDTITTANTRVLKNIVIYIPSGNALERPVKLGYDLKHNISWDPDHDAGYYDLFLRMNFEEKNKTFGNNWIEKSLNWKIATGIIKGNHRYLGKDFFIFLREHLQANNNIERRFSTFDLKVRAVGKELKNYTDILNSNLGITSSQQIPTYTNISNGFGVFSSINITEINGFYLSDETLDSLSNGIYTKDLNFK